MPLLKNGAVVEDCWRRIADDEPLPGAGPIIITLARWQADRALSGRRGPLGLALKNNEAVAPLANDVGHFELIALEFPKFTDGRAYSQARILREQYGFAGELRATGQVLRDQFVFMLRAGFDTFEVTKQADAEAFLETVRRYSVFYQPTGDGRGTALNARRQRGAIVAGPAREGILQDS